MAAYIRKVQNVTVEGNEHGYTLKLETRQHSYKAFVLPKSVTTGWIFKRTTQERFASCELVLEFADQQLWVSGPKEAAIVFETLCRTVRYKSEQNAKRKPGLLRRLLAAIKG